MNQNKINAWAGIIAFALLLVWIGSSIVDDVRISFNHRFAVGTITGWKRTGKGPVVYYKFLTNEQIFESGAPSGKEILDLDGGRYFVKFLPSDPTVSRILWDKPVPEHIKEAPSEGWEKIPQ